MGPGCGRGRRRPSGRVAHEAVPLGRRAVGAPEYTFRGKCYQKGEPFGELFHGTDTSVLGRRGQVPPTLLLKRRMAPFLNSCFIS